MKQLLCSLFPSILTFKFDLILGVLGGPVPPLYVSFPCVGTWVRVRKLVEDELTVTMKMKVVTLNE